MRGQGSEFRANSYTNDQQSLTSVASLTDGSFVVTWNSNGQDGSSYGIYGQTYNADGSKQGGDFRVNTFTTDGQSHASVTGLSDGGWVVSWHSVGQDGSGHGVYSQAYNADGTMRGSEFRINEQTAGDQSWPSVSSLTDGGFVVTLIERSADVHAMLEEGLERARCAGGQVADIVARMTLLFGDAKELLAGLSADVVVVDPMHPPRKTKALVKKEMRVLRQFVDADPDAEELVKAALDIAEKRVVLKWPAKADPLPGIKKPSHQLMGKSTRYDVFMTG